MRKLLLMAALFGLSIASAHAEPVQLNENGLQGIAAGLGEVSGSFNGNSIQDASNGNITLGDVTVAIPGDNRDTVYPVNQITSRMSTGVNINNLIAADAFGVLASEVLQ